MKKLVEAVDAYYAKPFSGAFERLAYVRSLALRWGGPKNQEALAIFLRNTKEHPDSWNVWDSLGEMYAVLGDKGNFAKVFAWYDNEWGFSNRMSDTAVALGKLG